MVDDDGHPFAVCLGWMENHCPPPLPLTGWAVYGGCHMTGNRFQNICWLLLAAYVIWPFSDLLCKHPFLHMQWERGNTGVSFHTPASLIASRLTRLFPRREARVNSSSSLLATINKRRRPLPHSIPIWHASSKEAPILICCPWWRHSGPIFHPKKV